MQKMQKVSPETLRKAAEILKQYKTGKANLEKRIIDNEQWYRLRHWSSRQSLADDPKYTPTSAWLFNSIANKHADAMDNYPMPAVLPREESDIESAKMLSQILPVVLDENDFESTYNDVWWYKLKHGTGVYGVFWNPQKAGGAGDIEITKVDLLNLFWEPGVNDIQSSKHLFHAELIDNETLKEQYEFLTNEDLSKCVETAKYIYDDSVDTRDKTPVIDWYYRKNGVLHYCKFVGETVLFSSENEEIYQNGYYTHGKYPFVFDVLYLSEGSPAGFGCIDIMKDPQMYIDRLGGLMLKNAEMASKKRFFIRDDGAVNEEEFSDWRNDLIHVAGGSLGEDSIRELITYPISDIYVGIMRMKIDELKETSGNRDFNQGATNSGVVAASAIAALQESGNKLSRDMIKASYRAFAEIMTLCVELIREFYSEPRAFRITMPNGEMQFISFDNTSILMQEGFNLTSRMPIFDIKVNAQKASPFSKAAQNELAKELYKLGFFNPDYANQALTAISMMDFDGKDSIINKITQKTY